MPLQPQQRISNGASRSTPNANQFPDPYVINRAPTVFDQGTEIGQLFVDTAGQTCYVFGGNDPANPGQFLWITNVVGAINAPSMTINPGDLVVTAGNVAINGAAATLTMQPGSTATLGTLLAGATIVTSFVNGGN